MSVKNELCFSCGGVLRELFEKVGDDIFEKTEEIRIRAEKGIKFKTGEGVIFVDKNGRRAKEDEAFVLKSEDLQQTALFLSGYSPFSYKEFISAGFITVSGGHRVGIAGHAVLKNGQTEMMRDISSFNIRICHEIKGCGEKLIKYIGGGRIKNTVIVSPPGCGKTTVLRDIARIISDEGKNVSVIDERGEICAVFKGKAQNDVGKNTDILDAIPKAQGIILALRSLGPDVIVCDEAGTEEDIEAIKTASLCGVSVLSTVHGSNMDDVRKRLKSAADEFEVFVFLNKTKPGGRIASIFDREKMIGEEML